MIQVRLGQFETNSSSVHVLVIPKDVPVSVPHKVFLTGGEYGWSADTEYDTLNYFYQACVNQGREELEKFFDYLKRKGVEEIHAPEINWVKSDCDGAENEYAENSGYIDHSSELPLDEMFANENLLDRFLFSNSSFVQTGNDNGGNCPDKDDYDSDVYDLIEKGN